MLQPYIGRLLSKNRPLFPALDLDGEGQNHTNIMEDTILKKKDKFTQIYFNEVDPMILAFCENSCFRSWRRQPPRRCAEKCAVQLRILASQRLASRDFAAEKAKLFLYSAMEIDTHNTNLKRRLTAYAKKHPDLCHIVSDDGPRGMTFAIDKRRCSLRLTAPYSEERKQVASELAKQSGIHTKSFGTPMRRRWREDGNS